MKYYALFVIFEKAANFEIVLCCNVSGTLRVKLLGIFHVDLYKLANCTILRVYIHIFLLVGGTSR